MRASGTIPFVLAALALAGCGVPEGVGVVARPETPELAPRKIGAETRPAHCLAPGGSVRIEAPGDATVLRIATGVAGDGARPLGFRVGFGAGPPLLEESGRVAAEGWVEHRLPIPAARRGEDVVLAVSGAAGARGSGCFGSPTFLGPAAPRPNLVLVSLDTLAATGLGRFGDPSRPSPRIDAFLADAFSFDRAFVQFGNTMVSHRSIFTGRYPSRQRRSVPVLAERLAAEGWLTAAVTENAYVGSAYGFARGFDRFLDGGGDAATAVQGHARETFEEALRWLGTLDGDAPFFLFVHTYEVHSPYLPREPASSAFADALTPDDDRRFEPTEFARAIQEHNQGERALGERDVRRYEALYRGEVHQLDARFGELLDGLDALGLADDTVVVVTSDHGEAFGQEGVLGHGKSLHRAVLQVPLAFRWPGRIAPGATEAVVQSVDIVPTVEALLGLATDAPADGRDLSPLLLGEAAALEPRAAFAEMAPRKPPGPAWRGAPPCIGGGYAVHTERFKLVECLGPEWARLYDVDADPDETRDVAAAHPAALARHRELLRDYRSRARGARPDGPSRGGVDPGTEERLRALGYLDD